MRNPDHLALLDLFQRVWSGCLIKAKSRLNEAAQAHNSAPCYFPVESIIAAGKLSFRVRDGNGRFLTAMGTDLAFVTLCLPSGKAGRAAKLLAKCGVSNAHFSLTVHNVRFARRFATS